MAGHLNRTAILNLALLLSGIVTTMLGPLLPAFQSRWALNDAQAGLLFPAQFLSAVAIAAVVGPLARRYGYFALIAPGLLLMALGTALCAFGSWPLAVGGVMVYGCGQGLAITSANLGTAAEEAQGRARAIVMLNLSWCIGAVIAPQLVASLGRVFLPSVAAAVAVSAALVAAYCGSGPRPRAVDGMSRISRAGWLASAMMFLYVGSESSIAGWISALATRAADTRALWAILPSVFWGGMLVGRTLAQPALSRVAARTLVPAGLLGASAAAAVLIANPSGAATVTAGALTGFGLAPVFPLVVAQYGERSSAPSGLVFSAAGLGGGVIPPFIGWLSTATGSLRAGMAIVLPLIAIIFWLQIQLAREAPVSAPRRTS
jgi:fucose permease